MSVVGFEIKGLDKFSAKLKVASKLKDYVHAYIGETAGEMRGMVVRNINRPQGNGRIIGDTGMLAKQTWAYENKASGLWGVITNTKYAQAVEKGTRPHHLPKEAIVGVNGEGGLLRWARLKVKAKDPLAFAYMVAKKIAERGQSKQPYFAPAFKEAIQRFKDKIRKGIPSLLK